MVTPKKFTEEPEPLTVLQAQNLILDCADEHAFEFGNQRQIDAVHLLVLFAELTDIRAGMLRDEFMCEKCEGSGRSKCLCCGQDGAQCFACGGRGVIVGLKELERINAVVVDFMTADQVRTYIEELQSYE